MHELKRKMQVQVEQAITGAIRKDRHSPRKVFRNLDLKTTLRRNLQNFDSQTGKLLVDQLFFYAAERKKKPWHVIVVVDQSGSMLESAIFSAVMASIFAELPAVKTSLVLFDTQIVDLSDQVGQPVDVLLSIQLGGGTDITQALIYANKLVRQPQRTIVVLITDFFEGRAESHLVAQTRLMRTAASAWSDWGRWVTTPALRTTRQLPVNSAKWEWTFWCVHRRNSRSAWARSFGARRIRDSRSWTKLPEWLQSWLLLIANLM